MDIGTLKKVLNSCSVVCLIINILRCLLHFGFTACFLLLFQIHVSDTPLTPADSVDSPGFQVSFAVRCCTLRLPPLPLKNDRTKAREGWMADRKRTTKKKQKKIFNRGLLFMFMQCMVNHKIVYDIQARRRKMVMCETKIAYQFQDLKKIKISKIFKKQILDHQYPYTGSDSDSSFIQYYCIGTTTYK